MKARSFLSATAGLLLAALVGLSGAPGARATSAVGPRVFVQVSRSDPAAITAELDDPFLTLVRDEVDAFYSVEPPTAPLGRLARALELSLGDVSLALHDQVVYYWVWDSQAGEFLRVCRPIPTLVLYGDTDPNPVVITVTQEV